MTLVLLKSKSIHHYLVVATVRAGSRGGCATIVLQIQVSFEAYNPPSSSSQAKRLVHKRRWQLRGERDQNLVEICQLTVKKQL